MTWLLRRLRFRRWLLAATAALPSPWGFSAEAATPGPAPSVTLLARGVPQLPIVAGSVAGPAAELEGALEEMAGAGFEVLTAREAAGGAGIHVGTAADFPGFDPAWKRQPGPEAFVLRSDGASVYLVGAGPAGVSHAVSTFLHRLGCRQFFPGEAWRVAPRRGEIAGRWDERGEPSFPTQRRIWYGYGAYPAGKRDLAAWERFNRMGGPVAVSIGHTWHGLDPGRDFAEHPEWFALVEGKRQPSKPCYSHPEVLQRAMSAGLRQAAGGKAMVSMTPPDGLGYCECDRCRAVFQGGEPTREHGTLFARRPDGVLVNITSETLFAFVNRVAAAVAAEHPDTLVGCYAYSAYSHPPSFRLHPNVYLQTTTAYRRTPITLEEQIAAFGAKTRQVGIREYYSVYQWDWDYPDPGKVAPDRLAEDLRFFHRSGVTAINAEASNNWAARGLGYYVAARLMWDVAADVDGVVRDFYQTAFGAAAPAMQRYYARWYGPGVAVLPGGGDPPAQRVLYERGEFDLDALRDAYLDLDRAARSVPPGSAPRRRVDQIRAYAHYLFLRYRLHQAEQLGERGAILAAVGAETVFGGRLTETNMIHARPLIGKAFPRRFKRHQALLEGVAAAGRHGGGWRRIGEPPGAEELEALWAADKVALGIR